MTGATVGKIAKINEGKFLLNQRVGCIRPNEKILSNFLNFLLLGERFYNYCQVSADGGAQGNISPSEIKKYKIPLPSIEVQQEIINDLEGFQKIIDGCRQVVETYKPKIEINPSWEIVELGEISEITMGQSPPGDTYNENNNGLSLINGPVEFGKDPFSKTIKRQFTTSPTKICKEGDLFYASVVQPQEG